MEKVMLAFLSLFTFKMMMAFNNGQINNMAPAVQKEQYDGPYVQYKGDKVFVTYIMEKKGKKFSVKTDSTALQQKDNLSLKVITDISGKFFQVRLKKELQNEKSEFPKVKNMVVLSDIEGNFNALRKLLQANKVIDEDLNWTFGDGNLVLVGDFFDRGQIGRAHV